MISAIRAASSRHLLGAVGCRHGRLQGRSVCDLAEINKINCKAMAQKAATFTNKRREQLEQNQAISDRVSQRVERRFRKSNEWFTPRFFLRHDHITNYQVEGADLWKPANWSTLAFWRDFHLDQPYYYDVGGFAYLVEKADLKMTDSTSFERPTSKWLPLGVFALATNPWAAPQTNQFLQLAFNSEGSIEGVMYHAATDSMKPLWGKSNETSQKVTCWLGNECPTLTTGLYNLTEHLTPITATFKDGSQKTWALVRLRQS